MKIGSLYVPVQKSELFSLQVDIQNQNIERFPNLLMFSVGHYERVHTMWSNYYSGGMFKGTINLGISNLIAAPSFSLHFYLTALFKNKRNLNYKVKIA
jgi:hypothetical protein